MSLISSLNIETGKYELVESNDSITIHAIDSGGIYLGFIPYTSGALFAGSAPPDTVGWYWDINRWNRLPPTLQELRDTKWRQIKEDRDAAINAPLSTPYGIFDSDQEARGNISDAVLLAQTLYSAGHPVAIDFTLANNAVVTLDLSQMITVGLMLGNKVQTVRGTATAIREQISIATEEELATITWS
jgi:hypothetical protein